MFNVRSTERLKLLSSIKTSSRMLRVRTGVQHSLRALDTSH